MRGVFLEKSFIYRGLVGVSVLLAGWFIVLNPVNRGFQKTRENYKNLEDEIKQIYDILGTKKDIPRRIVDILKRLEELKHKFPSKEEPVLKEISRAISDSGLSIKNISIMEKQVYNHSPVDGNTPVIVPLTVDVSGDFFSLGRFLDYLEGGFPYFVYVNQLDVYAGDIPAVVKAKIGMSIYLLVPEKGYEKGED